MSQSPKELQIGDPGFVFDSAKKQIPRRIVRLKGDAESDVREVLQSFEGAAVIGSKIHAEVQRLAAQFQGEVIALEWLGNMGWVRYLTCSR
jgi:hypothetical protein